MARPTASITAALLLLALAALALPACGSSDDAGTATTASTASTAAAPAAKARYTAAQVARVAGFERSADGTWTNATGCRITMILLTNAEVLKERTSQDALVVTNSSDDVGVKFDSRAGCREALLANLSQVK